MATSFIAPSKRDDSDQKTLKLLENMLSKLPKGQEPPLTKKQIPTKPSTPTRKRVLKADDTHPKITKFFPKESTEPKRCKKEPKRKPTPLDVTIKKHHKPSTSRSLKRNPSFDKYGIVLPSFEEIVADHKMFEAHKDSVKQLEMFDDGMLEMSLANDCLKESEFTGELLDCRHLSSEQLTAGFNRHFHKLKAIEQGEEFSERHNIFHGKRAAICISRDLRCSTSSAVFSFSQKEHLLGLMEKKLDPGHQSLGYSLKVLLPELCLLIFMDEHGMDKAEAVAYLDKRPLQFN